MSIRTVLVVLLALVFGVTAVMGVSMLRGRPIVAAAEPAKEEMVTVVVAVDDIPRFTTVTADMVKAREYPKAFAPAGGAAKVEDAVGRDTLAAILKDEPVLDGRLAARDAGRGLAAVIPTGMRAVTILTPSLASGVAGFILPGNKVDVLFTNKNHQNNDPNGGATTTTLLQEVEILAVDQRLDPAGATKTDLKELRSVTLLVSPGQATKLDLAQNLGSLHLSLRNPKDKEFARTEVATAAGLKFFQDKPLDVRLKEWWAMIPERKKPAEMEKPKEKEKEKVVEAAPVVPLPPIRTARGIDTGTVPLQ